MKLINNILYVSESSVAQGPSIARAVSVAENNQADLTVIAITPAITADIGVLPAGHTSDELQTAMVSESRKGLETLVEPFTQRLSIRVDVLVGRTYREVIRAILRDNYDLMIKPAENPNFIERLFGSDDMQLLRNCPCPVWITRSEQESDYTRVLAAVDVNPDIPDVAEQTLNQQILELSSSLAISKFAAMDVVHVWDAPFDMKVQSWTDNPREASMAYVEGERSRHERACNRLSQNLRDQIGAEAYDHLSPQFHMRRGAPSTVIPQTVKELQANLVVMGTVARTGIAGWLIGNTAEAILEQIQCSVLAVKPRGFVSPVKLTE